MKQSVGNHLEESFADCRNWKGVHDFVRVGMLGLLDLFRVNAAALRQLDRQMHGKANKTEIAVQLAGKLAVSDFAQLHERYSNQKTLVNSLSRVELELKSKMEELSVEVRSCRTGNQVMESARHDISQSLRQLEERLERSSIETKRQLDEMLLGKAERTEVDGLYRLNQTFECQLQQLQQSMADLSSRTAEFRIVTLQERLAKHQRWVQASASSHESFRARIEGALNCLQEELTSVSGSKTKLAEELVGILSKREEQKRLEAEHSQRELAKQRQTVEHLTARNVSLAKQLEGLTSRTETLELRQNNINKLRLDCSKEFSRLNELEHSLEELQARMDNPPDSSDPATKIVEALTETFDDELDKKVRAVREALEARLVSIEHRLVSKAELQQQLAAKIDSCHLEDSVKGLEQTLAENDGRHRRLLDKLDQLHEQFLSFKLNESRLNESFSMAIDTRVTSEQLQQCLADKVSYQDVRLVVGELTKKLEECAEKEKFQRFASNQATINETLCSENILARWVWNSHPLKNGNLVPWERQIINTLPENFVWDDGAATLTVTNGGLYQLEMGFYSRKKPTVQVIVNGVAVISAVNSNSYVVHHSSGKLKEHRSKEHPVGGLTLVDYFLLPARARIAVSYSGEELGEGFVSLRRL